MYTRNDNTNHRTPADHMPRSLAGEVGMVHGVSPETHWPLYQAAGWRKFQPFEVPAGMVAVPHSRTTTDDGDTVVEHYETITADQHAAEHLFALVRDHGAEVAVLGRLLALFTDPATEEPFAMPIDPEYVFDIIKQGLATGTLPVQFATEATALEVRYGKLRLLLSDAEIAAVAEALEAQQ